MSSANAGRRSGLVECCASLARQNHLRRRRWWTIAAGGPWHSSHVAARTFVAASHEERQEGSSFDDETSSSRAYHSGSALTTPPPPPPPPPPPAASFRDMGLHPVLVERLQQLGITVPTTVQASAFPALLTPQDVTIGSETGSGKTLAYLLPILHDILTRRDALKTNKKEPATTSPHEYARALILVPNKELVQQVVRMATPLAGGPQAVLSSASASPSSSPTPSSNDDDHLIRLAVLPGGLDDPDDFRPFRDALQGVSEPPDIVVSTPATAAPWGIRPKCIGFFADLQTLVVDEADMCVDGGYIRAVEQVLLGFKRADRMLAKYRMDETAREEESHPVSSSLLAGVIPNQRTQHVFVAATLPDYGLRSVAAWLSRKFPRMVRVETDDLHRARHSGLTETTQWIQLESKKERMQHLVNLLHAELSNDKTMVFCNSVDDAESVSEALQRVGFENAVPYHAKLSLPDRTQNLEQFRSYQPPSPSFEEEEVSTAGSSTFNPTDAVVLVCTDLASRGLDVPGVTAVVQLQFAGNAVAHLHRMGRCGRAQTERGRGVVYYGAQESELVQVLRDAEVQQEQGSSSLQLAGEVKDEAAWNDPVDVDDDDDDDDDVDDLESSGSALRESPSPSEDGSIRNAFSRKRGFTKKRKKTLRSSTTGVD